MVRRYVRPFWFSAKSRDAVMGVGEQEGLLCTYATCDLSGILFIDLFRDTEQLFLKGAVIWYWTSFANVFFRGCFATNERERYRRPTHFNIHVGALVIRGGQALVRPWLRTFVAITYLLIPYVLRHFGHVTRLIVKINTDGVYADS